MRENQIMKILVKAVAPLADPAIVRCTSDADFLVYGAPMAPATVLSKQEVLALQSIPIHQHLRSAA